MSTSAGNGSAAIRRSCFERSRAGAGYSYQKAGSESSVNILMHICCAPCSIYPLRLLREEGANVAGLFFNPNVHPFLEYRRRLETLREYAVDQGVEVALDEPYAVEEFLRRTVFREAERCRICYQMRLERTARRARRDGFGAFTTTLLYSRFQKHDLIRRTGEEMAEKYGVPFVYRDFREGWTEGVRVSKALGMYRQNYCGCLYSEKERFCRSG